MSALSKLVCILGFVLGLAGCQTLAEQSASHCSPLGYDKQDLLSLKSDEFRISDAQQRQSFALELTDCLGDSDPSVRDGIAYEAFVTLLRGQQLAPETVQTLRTRLLEMLGPGPEDRDGFRRPFAALTLAEVARADRLENLFSSQQRAEVVSAATEYMLGITDYRGFNETDGWRHGVAHTADLFLQLVLNPALTVQQLTDIADALAGQVAPAGDHFYVYGEYERLARPLYYLANRGELTEQYWTVWFAGLATPAPFETWGDIWTSQAGLAKLHNTKVFAETVYLYATANETEEVRLLSTGALNLLKALN